MAKINNNIEKYNLKNRPILSPKEFVEKIIESRHCSISRAIADASEELGVAESSLTHWFYERRTPEICVYYHCATVAQELELN